MRRGRAPRGRSRYVLLASSRRPPPLPAQLLPDAATRAKGRLRRLQKVKEPTGKHAIDDPDRGPVPPSATDPAI